MKIRGQSIYQVSQKSPSGLRLQGCHTKTTDIEKTKIDQAIQAVTSDNAELRKAFDDYYSDHDIYKMDADDAEKAMKRGLYATTKPNSDTYLRPDVVAPDYSNVKLGLLLIHEFIHTRHHENINGSSGYEEGDSYGIEYFLAVRFGHKERQTEIIDIMGNPTALVIQDQVDTLRFRFLLAFAAMTVLYEVIDSGKSTHTGSPLETLTRAEAKGLVAELVSVTQEDHSPSLTTIMKWIGGHLSEFKSPIYDPTGRY